MALTNELPQPIIDLMLADVNAILTNLSILVTSYRLLVGGAEEIRRTPEFCPGVFQRAERRADNAGTLIDIFLELLYSKMIFSSDFLKISGAPVDLFRLLANPNTATDIPFKTGEQVVEIEILRQLLEIILPHLPPRMPQHTVVCEKPPAAPVAPTTPAAPTAPTVSPETTPTKSTDIEEVTSVLLTELQSLLATPTQPQLTTPAPSPLSPTREAPVESRVRRKHLRDAYDTMT